MKLLFIFIAALVACTAAYDIELLSEEEWNKFVQEETVTPEELGLIVNAEAKKRIQNFLQQMQCGWPEYGIPPLAPYTNPNVHMEVARSVVDSLLDLFQFRLDGLDKMEVVKLKISVTINKNVKFHFNFRELLSTATTFSTDTFIDMLQQLGLTVRYEGAGPFQFALDNLSIFGQFKYKMPLMFGSIKIYDFQATLALGGVRSNIGGILGDGRMNQLLNDKLEYFIPTFINGHQAEIGAYVENILVPRVNEHFQGKKIWSLIFGGSSNGKCNPVPPPW